MHSAIRQTIGAAVATVTEIRGWDGSLEGAVHINSYTGSHVFQNTDAAEEAALQEVCNRLLEIGGVDSQLVEEEIGFFESEPSIDTLTLLAQAIVDAGGSLREL
jgi:hypothetical protein